VTKINGVEASKYVLDTINTATYNQDVDAAYNSMFFEKATYAVNGVTGYFSGGGRIRYIYQGPNTTFTFANGTVLTLENTAAVKANMTGVVDGASYAKKFASGSTSDAAEAIAEVAAAGDAAVVPGYPQPVISTEDGIVSGYYLTGDGLDHVAVLALLAFENESPAEFQAVAADFIREAKAAGKTKLVVDFQANGGGYILQGYDFFRQLFPTIQEGGLSRWRENDGFLATAKIYSDAVANLDPYTSADGDLVNAYESWFNYRYDLNLTLQPFKSFEDKFAPHVYKNTPYTALMRWNLSDPLTTVNETYGMGMEITGYGTLSNETQPFAAEDIVLLYDGVCASTCTIAAEFLRLQGGVKSIAMGGRPFKGPIQGVGGIKGAQSLSFASILSYTQYAASLPSTPEQKAALARYNDLPIRRSSSTGVNARDAILPDNVNDGVPAQYIVEEADCRLYWTKEMIGDVTAVWKAAAQAAFNGGKCAFGGIAAPKKRDAEVVGASVMALPRRSEMVKRSKVPESEAWRAMYRQKAIP
jgi:hypothetical protein